jgi:acyl-CoA synthetase (NDP forming)
MPRDRAPCWRTRLLDALLVLLTPQRTTDSLACARAVIEAARRRRKPVLACWMGQNLVAEARRALDDAGVLQFTSPERCLDAFAYLAAYERHQAVLLQAPAPRSEQKPPDVQGAQLMIEDAIRQRRRLTVIRGQGAAERLPHSGAAQHQRQFGQRCAGGGGDPGAAGQPARQHAGSAGGGQALPRRSVRDAPSVRTPTAS